MDGSLLVLVRAPCGDEVWQDGGHHRRGLPKANALRSRGVQG